jgi:Tfp pilus assembly protein PilF
MLTALFLTILLSQSNISGGGSDRCSVEDGPEVGIGILCERARIAIEARELSVAESLALKASKLAPSYPGVWIVRAEVAQSGRRVDEARGFYEKASGLAPSNAAILVSMGDFEAEEGNVRGAAVLYEKAAEIAPDLPGLAERLEAVSDEPAASEI